MEDRERLRATFDTAAAKYADARPSYPDELIEQLVESTGVTSDSRLVEVGCGPGTATQALALRNFRITALELGPALAAVARLRLQPFPRVEVVNEPFETWAGERHSIDLVYAATAWHWIDPDIRYRRAWELLRPGGHLAWWTAGHILPEDADPFFREIQTVYDEIGEGLPPGVDLPTASPIRTDEIEESGLFDVSYVKQFRWDIAYDTVGYLALLSSFSGHIAMEPSKREYLFAEITRRISERSDGRIRKHWGSALHIARRREVP